MKKLSSDVLYYRSLVGLFIGPILIIIFVRIFWAQSFTDNIIIIIYFLLIILVLVQSYKQLKYRKVLYSSKSLTIKTYFSKDEITVPLSEIIDLKKAFSLARKPARFSYKMKFNYRGKQHAVYFFKALELYNVEDLKTFLGITN